MTIGERTNNFGIYRSEPLSDPDSAKDINETPDYLAANRPTTIPAEYVSGVVDVARAYKLGPTSGPMGRYGKRIAHKGQLRFSEAQTGRDLFTQALTLKRISDPKDQKLLEETAALLAAEVERME